MAHHPFCVYHNPICQDLIGERCTCNEERSTTSKITKPEKQVKAKDDNAPTYVDETPTVAMYSLTHVGCLKSGQVEHVRKSDMCQACCILRITELEEQLKSLKGQLDHLQLTVEVLANG